MHATHAGIGSKIDRRMTKPTVPLISAVCDHWIDCLPGFWCNDIFGTCEPQCKWPVLDASFHKSLPNVFREEVFNVGFMTFSEKGDKKTHSLQSHPVQTYKLSTSHRYMSVISDTYPVTVSGAGGY